MKGVMEISEKVWKFAVGILIFLLFAGVLFVVWNVFSKNAGTDVKVIIGTVSPLLFSGRKKGMSMVLLLSIIFIITTFMIALTVYDAFSPEAQKSYTSVMQEIASNTGGWLRGLFGLR